MPSSSWWLASNTPTWIKSAGWRNLKLQVMEDMEKEHTKELRAKDTRIKELEERSLKYERRVDELKAELAEIRRELYAVKGELDDEKEKSKAETIDAPDYKALYEKLLNKCMAQETLIAALKKQLNELKEGK